MARTPYQHNITQQVYDRNGISHNEQKTKAVVVNRSGAGTHWDCKCLATDCMMWRTVLNDPDDGHCGLAGFAPHGGGM